MARGYPRFLYCDPQNTKSKGPFIIHCLEPRIIFKITDNFDEFKKAKLSADFDFKDSNKNFFFILLDNPNDENFIQYQNTMMHAIEWLESQIKTGQINPTFKHKRNV